MNYEHKTVKAARAADKFVVSKMAKDGWELVDSDVGRISTTLTFRRPKKPVNRLLIGAGAAGVLAIVVAIGVGTALENGGTEPGVEPQPTASAVAAPSAEVSSSQPQENAEPDVMTVENNADLAAVLAGPKQGRTVEGFSEKYRTKLVEFDAFVTELDVNPRPALGESTISVRAGASNDRLTGPVFQFSWFGHDSPMEGFPEGTKVRVRGMVGAVYEFEPHQFFLIAENDNALTRR